MPKPTKFTYEKREPYRDAFFFIVICEGQNREPAYFRFFEGMSSRVKIITIGSENGLSSPLHLIQNAEDKIEALGALDIKDRIWFVIDTDNWLSQIHILREECISKGENWRVAQSNPCFEVWLYYHVKNEWPTIESLDKCTSWKSYVHTIIDGGFNSDYHPIAVEKATQNSKQNYREEGYLPKPGSTQVWQLTEEIIPLIRKELSLREDSCPSPELSS